VGTPGIDSDGKPTIVNGVIVYPLGLKIDIDVEMPGGGIVNINVVDIKPDIPVIQSPQPIPITK
jgi:hypothetical protein